MAGSNNFLVFNPGKVNQASDSNYNVSIYRSGGIPAIPGAAPSIIHNKLFYQVSMMASALAQMLADRGYAVSDASFTDLVTTLDALTDLNLWKSLTSYAVGDVVVSRNATSYKRMECTVAGITNAAEPTWTAVGQTIVDGTCSWKVTDIRDSRHADTAAHADTADLADLADSATVLHTARYINGVPFNGSADIDIIVETFSRGMIMLWAGSIATVPLGWALCNGTNGTPNLQNKFIIGAGSSYGVSVVGGETSHVLAVEEIPAHRHVDPYSEEASPGVPINGFDAVPGVGNVAGSGDTDYNQPLSYGGYEGGTGYSDAMRRTLPSTICKPHNNMPPYYALAYIMKL